MRENQLASACGPDSRVFHCFPLMASALSHDVSSSASSVFIVMRSECANSFKFPSSGGDSAWTIVFDRR